MEEAEHEDCVQSMKCMRNFIVGMFPEQFQKGDKTEFHLVVKKAQELILNYMNLKNLMGP